VLISNVPESSHMLPLGSLRDPTAPLKILCLGAHCDDIEIGAGGTILQLLAGNRNLAVTWVVFSSNKERSQEARSSAELFLKRAAKKETIIENFRDGYFPFDGQKIKDFIETLKAISPDVVFTHTRKDAHQDHRQICELTWNTFRNHLILEYEIPKYDGDMGQPNVFSPLEKDICTEKNRIILESFGSQQAKKWFSENTFFALMRLRGMECNAPSGYAEAFYGRKLLF